MHITHRERVTFFKETVPDVVDDPITDTARALSVSNIEQVFFKAAEDSGFTDPQTVATHRYNQWKQSGYQSLPPYIKDFCARTLNRLTATEFINRVVE